MTRSAEWSSAQGATHSPAAAAEGLGDDQGSQTLPGEAPHESIPLFSPPIVASELRLSLAEWQALQAGRASAPPHEMRRSALKAKLPDLYYGKSHQECYEFCRQCEEHFETVGYSTSWPECVSFAAGFLRDDTGSNWNEYKESFEPGHGFLWNEFKSALRKALGDANAFIDATWGSFLRDSQRQGESVRKYSAHLQHLRSILREYDPVGTPTEGLMIRRLREGLLVSIKAQLYNTGDRTESWSEFLNNVMSAKAAAKLQNRSVESARRRGARNEIRPRPEVSSSEKSDQEDRTPPAQGSFRREKRRNQDLDGPRKEQNRGRSQTSTPQHPATGVNATPIPVPLPPQRTFA